MLLYSSNEQSKKEIKEASPVRVTSWKNKIPINKSNQGGESKTWLHLFIGILLFYKIKTTKHCSEWAKKKKRKINWTSPKLKLCASFCVHHK